MTQKFIDALKSVKPTIFDCENTNLFVDSIIDSLDIMNIVSTLEDEFNVELDIEDLSSENFVSAQTIWDLVQKKKGN